MKTLLFILTLSTLTAKEFTVKLTDCISVTYIDKNEDATFDSLIIDECGMITRLKLKDTLTVGKPDIEDYTNGTFEVRLVNYNNFHNDAYFQVRLVNQDTIYGYWEHIMGSYKLEWK